MASGASDGTKGARTRAAIITHDLKAEPRSNLQTFETVEDLIDSLHGA